MEGRRLFFWDGGGVVWCSIMYFSCFAKKSTKRRRLKEALRAKAPSLRIHPPLRQPVSKNVPIFGHLQLKIRKISPGRLPKIGTFSGVGWRCGGGFQRGGAPRSESINNMIAGGNHTIIHTFARSAPLADFFGYFLVQRQESNITAPSIKGKDRLSAVFCLV